MDHKREKNRDSCIRNCELAFIRCTARKPSGCVETLRYCREQCPHESSSRQDQSPDLFLFCSRQDAGTAKKDDTFDCAGIRVSQIYSEAFLWQRTDCQRTFGQKPSQKSLSVPGCVTKRFKMLTYFMCMLRFSATLRLTRNADPNFGMASNQLIPLDDCCRRVKLVAPQMPMTEDASQRQRVVCQEI